MGHVLAEAIADISIGEEYGPKFGHWRMPQPYGQVDPKCWCGADFVRGYPNQLHIEGRGWCP